MKSENSVFSAKKVEDYKLPFEKLPNYFQFFDYENAYQPAYDPFDEIVKAGADSEYIPRQFRVSEQFRQQGVSPVITGLIDMIQQDPVLKSKIRITSTYRPNAVTSSGNPSRHGYGMAVDLVPTNGNYEELERLLMQNDNIRTYMMSNKLGLLDEYTPEGMARTKAKDKHMHIGDDKLAVSDMSKLMIKYGYANN